MLTKPSCPACGNPTMYALATYLEEDVNESASVDAYVPHRSLGWFSPKASVAITLASWVSNLLFGKYQVARNRAKLRAARQNILPRSPNSLVCPSCFEVLERL